MKGELDLFTVPPTQTSIEHGTWVEYHPLSTITDGAPIEFDVNGTVPEKNIWILQTVIFK
jgi:hypothetical protein